MRCFFHALMAENTLLCACTFPPLTVFIHPQNLFWIQQWYSVNKK